MTTGAWSRTYAAPVLDPTAAPPPPEPPDAPQRRRAGVRFDVLALAGFAAVFAAVKLNRTAAFDVAITLRLQARRSPRVARVMEAVSWPGFPPQSRVIPPGIAVFLWLRRYRLEAAFQAAAWGTALLSTAVKEVTQRQRPLPPDVQVVVAKLRGSSFPSGHVLTYVPHAGGPRRALHRDESADDRRCERALHRHRLHIRTGCAPE